MVGGISRMERQGIDIVECGYVLYVAPCVITVYLLTDTIRDGE